LLLRYGIIYCAEADLLQRCIAGRIHVTLLQAYSFTFKQLPDQAAYGVRLDLSRKEAAGWNAHWRKPVIASLGREKAAAFFVSLP
jgi:hypothetical protein